MALMELGHDEVDIIAALHEFSEQNPQPPQKPSDEIPRLSPKTRYILLAGFAALAALVLAGISVFFDSETRTAIFITLTIFMIKAAIFSLLVYVIILLGERKSPLFYKCFLVAVFLVLVGMAPVPILRLLLIAMAALLAMLFFMDSSAQSALGLIVAVLIVDILLGVALPALQETLIDDPSAHLRDGSFCTPNKQADPTKMSYIQTGSGALRDFCTESPSIELHRAVDRCTDCYLVEYTCHFFRSKTLIFNCTQCERGAC